MGLVLPNLDDLTFDQLIEEARSLIPTLDPEWTDHNPSDPGIMIIEMLAWLTEMTLYRVNEVPDSTVRAALDLLDPEGREHRSADPRQAIRDVLKLLQEPWRAVVADDYRRLLLDGSLGLRRDEAPSRVAVVPRTALTPTGELEERRGHVTVVTLFPSTRWSQELDLAPNRTVHLFNPGRAGDGEVEVAVSEVAVGEEVGVELQDGEGSTLARWDLPASAGPSDEVSRLCKLPLTGVRSPLRLPVEREEGVVQGGRLDVRHSEGQFSSSLSPPLLSATPFTGESHVDLGSANALGWSLYDCSAEFWFRPDTLPPFQALFIQRESAGRSYGLILRHSELVWGPVGEWASSPGPVLPGAVGQWFRAKVSFGSGKDTGPGEEVWLRYQIQVENASGSISKRDSQSWVRVPSANTRLELAGHRDPKVFQTPTPEAFRGAIRDVTLRRKDTLLASWPLSGYRPKRLSPSAGPEAIYAVPGAAGGPAAEYKGPFPFGEFEHAYVAAHVPMRGGDTLVGRVETAAALPGDIRIRVQQAGHDLIAPQQFTAQNAFEVTSPLPPGQVEDCSVSVVSPLDLSGAVSLELSLRRDEAGLCEAAAAALEPRRLLGTRLHVIQPARLPLIVNASLYLETGAMSAAVEERARRAILDFYDPETGGHDDGGWPFGQAVEVAALLALLDGIEGVHHATGPGGAVLPRAQADPGELSRRPPEEQTAYLGEPPLSTTVAGREVVNDATKDLVALRLEPHELVEVDSITLALFRRTQDEWEQEGAFLRITLQLYVKLAPPASLATATLASILRQRVYSYFDPVRGGRGSGWKPGDDVPLADLAAHLKSNEGVAGLIHEPGSTDSMAADEAEVPAPIVVVGAGIPKPTAVPPPSWPTLVVPPGVRPWVTGVTVTFYRESKDGWQKVG